MGNRTQFYAPEGDVEGRSVSQAYKIVTDGKITMMQSKVVMLRKSAKP